MPYIAGVAVHRPQPTEEPSLEELAFAAASAALADAGLDREDIDGICLGASDQLDARAISSMHLAGPSGGCLRDEVKVADDGSVAFAAAVSRIEAGVSHRVLVVTWHQPGASDEMAALGVNPEPIYARPAGLHPWAAEAMVVQDFMRAAGLTVDDVDAWVAQAGCTGAPPGEWLAYPLRRSHLPPASRAAVALVLTAAPAAVGVRGLAWGADAAGVVDRGGVLGSLPGIATMAYRQAGLSSPAEVPVETTDRSAVRRAVAAVGLGLVDIAKAHQALEGGQLARLNSSGGLWQSNPVFAAGPECIARATQHVRRGASKAVAHASYGFAGQGNLVTVLGQVKSV